MAYKEKKTSNIARILFSILLIILGIWSLGIYFFGNNDEVMLIPGLVLLLVGIMMLRNTLSKKY